MKKLNLRPEYGNQMKMNKTILKTIQIKHCACCGQKSNLPLLGPYEVGPYKWVCKTCHDLPSTWYPDKKKNVHPQGTIEQFDFKFDFNKKLNILLIEPNYYTKFPPLGLLKIATFHRNRGDNIELIRLKEKHTMHTKLAKEYPNIIYVTSLFTWSWQTVYSAISFYKRYYSEAKIILGGIYASVLPDHAALSGADIIHIGLAKEVEDLSPAYDLIPKWNGNILFTTRGCIRRCSFCVVPKVEGSINSPKNEIYSLLDKNHKRVFIWDNNILAAPNFSKVIEDLKKFNKKVDFNQGLDARLVTPEIAKKLRELKLPFLHLAYDDKSARNKVKRAIQYLKDVGFKGKKMIFYTLFNHKDTPDDFLNRLKDLMKWGVVSYPMRFEPLTSLEKNQYISSNWTKKQLDLVSKARRVIGYGGAFPPYKALMEKFLVAKTLEEALYLRPIIKQIKIKSYNLNDFFDEDNCESGYCFV